MSKEHFETLGAFDCGFVLPWERFLWKRGSTQVRCVNRPRCVEQTTKPTPRSPECHCAVTTGRIVLKFSGNVANNLVLESRKFRSYRLTFDGAREEGVIETRIALVQSISKIKIQTKILVIAKIWGQIVTKFGVNISNRCGEISILVFAEAPGKMQWIKRGHFDDLLRRHQWRHKHKNSCIWHNLPRRFHIWSQIEAIVYETWSWKKVSIFDPCWFSNGNRNQNQSALEKCPMGHRLCQYLFPCCTMRIDRLFSVSKFNLLFDLVT